MEKATFTVKEAADYLGVSVPLMYEITFRADFYPLLRVNSKKLIVRDKFKQWIDEQTGKEV